METPLLFRHVVYSRIRNAFNLSGIDESKTRHDLKVDYDPKSNHELRDAFVYEILFSKQPVPLILNYQMAGRTRLQLREMKSWIKDFMKIEPSQLQYFFDDSIPLPDEYLDYRSDTFIYKEKRNEVLALIEDPKFLGELRRPKTRSEKPFTVSFLSDRELMFKEAFVNLIMPKSRIDFELFLSGENPKSPIVVKRNKKEFILYFLALEMKELLVGEDESPIYGRIPFLLSKYFVLDEINAGSANVDFDSNYVSRILSEHRISENELRHMFHKYEPLKKFLFSS